MVLMLNAIYDHRTKKNKQAYEQTERKQPTAMCFAAQSDSFVSVRDNTV